MTRRPLAVRIHRIRDEDWPLVRDIRLAMLHDTPIAYGETLQTALALGDEDWVARAARDASGTGVSVAAVRDDGMWVGRATGFDARATGATLVGVYVTPDARGRGVLDAMLVAVEQWATGFSDTLALEVHEDNLRAARAYARLGFVPTGGTRPYELDPGRRLIGMIKRLR